MRAATWVIRASMAAAFGMIALMAIRTAGDARVHPDENLHFACFDFYRDRFWPPAVDHPGVERSLRETPMGYSYLSEWDVVYFVAGHAVAPLRWLLGWELGAARAFQALLWILLLALACRSRTAALTCGVALLSPQIWYVFSYFNGDAFPLVLSLAAATLIAGGEVDRWIEGNREWRPALALSLCLGLLLVSKRNYLPVVAGMLAWIATLRLELKLREIAALFGALAAFGVASFANQVPAWREEGTRAAMLATAGALGCFAATSLAWRVRKRSGLRTPAKRLALLLALCVAVALPRVAQDLWVNGGPARKAVLLRETAEKFSTAGFKPSVLERGGGWPTAAMAAKGVSLKRMLADYQWVAISAYSSFGVYGYMSVWAGTPWLYRTGIVLTLLTAGLALRDLWRREAHMSVRLGMVFAGACALILLSSILYSWVAGFQPQGRYLLPMFAMIGLLNGSAGGRAWPLWIGFAASALSFVGVGLAWAFR